jgi:enhancing lycopene biosynthesis protein 2
MSAAICGEGTSCTIGNDTATAAAIEAMGAVHLECPVTEARVDTERKLVTTPAYMLAGCVSDAYRGISDCVKKVLALV